MKPVDETIGNAQIAAMLSVLDIFRIGVGPSSSHTVGPMRIAALFVRNLKRNGKLPQVTRLALQLQGSLALTGIGHGTVEATLLGLMGHRPESYDLQTGADNLVALAATGQLSLIQCHIINFDRSRDIELAGHIVPDLHPNGMRLSAWDESGGLLQQRTYYSTGGGFIASETQLAKPARNDRVKAGSKVRHPFASAAELLELCDTTDQSIAQLMLTNEEAFRPRSKTEQGLDRVAQVMDQCVDRGLRQRGVLPGGLNVRRRAPEMWERLQSSPAANEREELFDWLNCFAMAVNEENAAGGRVVTAPTNGAAGILPAVMRFYCRDNMDRDCQQKRREFLLTAGAIGLLYKQRASISGAEMGCQGEVGVACSMAAAALTAIWGGTPTQITSAAEIGMEHNLGLTCDPVGGLVQVPCIERNAIGAVKAVNAARLALQRDDAALVTLDQVIETMRQTGLDMSAKYKETSQGGLAVNVIEC